ncbi:PucR family transcriptional regulator [Nocardia sp. NPDC056064]|uniref:PucR family transcriptional regulator n=1 Tax=Nocardia sp. NPDC056064 TaxID=3345701 RepID=UPI0035DD4963
MGYSRTGVAQAVPGPCAPAAELRQALVAELRETGAIGPGDRHLATITRVCLAVVDGLNAGAAVAPTIGELDRYAAQWARDQVPVDTVLALVHRGVGVALRPLPGQTIDAAALTTALGAVSAAISGSYARCLVATGGTFVAAEEALARKLLAGADAAQTARGYGVEPAEQYWVLALGIDAADAHAASGIDRRVREHRMVARVRAELAAVGSGRALSVLSATGGTALLPWPQTRSGDLEAITNALTRAAQTPVLGAVTRAGPTEIAEAGRQAHELLALLRRRGVGGGVHRFEDHALECQIARPGPARDLLAAVLRPLADHPELFHTLRCYVDCEMSRRRTADALRLHINTVDYRLRRIAALTGYDLTDSHDVWYVRSALVVTEPPAATA